MDFALHIPCAIPHLELVHIHTAPSTMEYIGDLKAIAALDSLLVHHIFDRLQEVKFTVCCGTDHASQAQLAKPINELLKKALPRTHERNIRVTLAIVKGPSFAGALPSDWH